MKCAGAVRGLAAAALLWFGCAGWIGQAHADGKRVAIRSFDGARSAKVRDAVVDALSDEVEVVSSQDVQRAAASTGADPDSADGRVTIARELQLDAWVEGRVEHAGRNWTLVLAVASGDSGDAAEASEITARDPVGLARKAESGAWDQVSGLIAQSARPAGAAEAAEPEPEPEEEAEPLAEQEEEQEPEEDEPEDEAQPEEDDDDDGERPMALAIELGAGGFSRDLEYRDNLSVSPTYDISVPPFGRLGLQWFPAAHFQSGALAHIGLRAEGQMAFGLSSELDDGSNSEFSTSSNLLEVGLRGRVPLGAFQLGADVSFGAHSYSIESAKVPATAALPAGEVDPGIPSASYSYVRLHADFGVSLGDSASLAIGGGVLPLLGTGAEVERWFPQASGLAIEGNVTFAYGLSSVLDLVATLGARRYAVTFEPTVADVTAGRRIAAGMVDQYVAGQLGLRFRLGGQP